MFISTTLYKKLSFQISFLDAQTNIDNAVIVLYQDKEKQRKGEIVKDQRSHR